VFEQIFDPLAVFAARHGFHGPEYAEHASDFKPA